MSAEREYTDACTRALAAYNAAIAPAQAEYHLALSEAWAAFAAGRSMVSESVSDALEAAQARIRELEAALAGAREAAIRECVSACSLIERHDPTGIMSMPADFARACLDLLAPPAAADGFVHLEDRRSGDKRRFALCVGLSDADVTDFPSQVTCPACRERLGLPSSHEKEAP